MTFLFSMANPFTYSLIHPVLKPYSSPCPFSLLQIFKCPISPQTSLHPAIKHFVFQNSCNNNWDSHILPPYFHWLMRLYSGLLHYCTRIVQIVRSVGSLLVLFHCFNISHCSQCLSWIFLPLAFCYFFLVLHHGMHTL